MNMTTNKQNQRKIAVHQPTFFTAGWNHKKGEAYYTATGAPKKGDGQYKVLRADVVRYGRDLVKDGSDKEGTIVTDTQRIETAPVMLFASKTSYQSWRAYTAPRDEYGDVDVDNEQEELAAYDDTMAAQDEMSHWG